MEPIAWIALCSLSFVVVTTILGAVWAGVRTVVHTFETHERSDETRYRETIVRLTRLETLVINGAGRKSYDTQTTYYDKEPTTTNEKFPTNSLP